MRLVYLTVYPSRGTGISMNDTITDAMGDSMLAAVEAAEAEALAEHNAGRCHLSQWSCSHCEAEATS